MGGCGDGTTAGPEPTPTESSQRQLAERIAKLDKASNTKPYEQALTKLGTRCKQNRGDVAALVQVLHTDLRKDGLHDSALSIARNLYKSIPKSAGRMDCIDIGSAWENLRTG